jgi:diguanylate cyclase (GGDEF)-like protein
LIQKSIDNGEGYHSYWWQRPDSDLPAERLSYARLFPEWEWVIGTGVYIDDLQTEILVRKEKMIDELRQILGKISIAKTGYLYIFDSWNNIIIHPEQDLENSDMSKLINPSNKHKLVDDLIKASKSSEHKLSYKWNKPSDKSHYIYDKIDWVRHVKGFDWYIVASVYNDELNASSNLLRNKIIIIAGVVVFMSIIIVALLMGRLLMPIRKLAIVAGQVEDGDLLARCEVKGKDEISTLARAFNRMVDRLRGNIEELDQKVADRTKKLNVANDELTSMVGQLEHHNEEITYLNLLSEQLQVCDSLEDVYPVVADFMTMLFPETGGMMVIADSDGKELAHAVSWGGYQEESNKITVDDCLSIRDNEVFICERPGESEICSHIKHSAGQHLSFCLPLKARNRVLGIIFIRCQEELFGECAGLIGDDRDRKIAHMKSLATSVIDHIAPALANIQLMIRLQHLSVRDGLTGLFNRRYMEETMTREFQQAERQGLPVGVIMLDVDFFKKFNDTYGHDAGDLVLIELAKVLRENVRKEDVVCRYGGEEFVIIMPGPPVGMAIERAEIIRKQVDEKLRIKYKEHTFHVNISLGAAFYPKHGNEPEVVLKAADDALYQAKEQGRNQAVAAS